MAWYGRTTRTVELASGTAVWYHGGEPVVLLRWVLLRDPQALLSTDQDLAVQQIVAWFVQRWQVDVTFEEARASGRRDAAPVAELAILRTTPALLGLFSLITLFAHQMLHGQELPVRQAAWYPKTVATFSDTLAFVRQQLWPVNIFWRSPAKDDRVIIPKTLFDRLTDTLAYAVYYG